MSTKTINNKVYLTENVLIFEDSGAKIITGVSEDELGTQIRDMTINPGDTVITTEGSVNVMKTNNTFTDISTGGGGSGADTNLSNLDSPTAINQALLPDATNTHNLGSFGARWNNVFFNGINNTGVATLNGGASMQGQLITNVADPVSAQDGATKAYVDASATAVKVKYSFAYTDFNASPGTSIEVPLFTLPAKAILTEIVIHGTVQFAGTLVDGVDVYVGLTGQPNKYAQFISSDPVSGTAFARMVTPFLENIALGTDVVVTVETSGVGDLDDLTQGTFDVYVEYKLLAD